MLGVVPPHVVGDMGVWADTLCEAIMADSITAQTDSTFRGDKNISNTFFALQM